MATRSSVTRRQHHVWQKYLSSWAKSGAVVCLNGEKLISTGTRHLAVEVDFYKIQALTESDQRHIAWLISKANPKAQEAHWDYINRLMMPLHFGRQLPTNAARTQWLDDYATQALEDHHTGVEKSFGPILTKLLEQRSADFYAHNGKTATFLRFLCTQYMRTKGIKERSSALRGVPELGFDIGRIWNVIVPILASNIAAALFCERHQRELTVIHNRTHLPFITGDQPVINLAHEREDSGSPEKLVIYYPLSPDLAIVLGEVNEPSGYSEHDISVDQVEGLNRRIYNARHRQVFACSELALRLLTK